MNSELNSGIAERGLRKVRVGGSVPLRGADARDSIVLQGSPCV